MRLGQNHFLVKGTLRGLERTMQLALGQDPRLENIHPRLRIWIQAKWLWVHFQALRVSIQRSYPMLPWNLGLYLGWIWNYGKGSCLCYKLLKKLSNSKGCSGLGCLRSSWLCSCIFHLGCYCLYHWAQLWVHLTEMEIQIMQFIMQKVIQSD